MGRPARSLHDAGNHRTVERRSPRQAARRGGGLTIPASPAGERETTAALTPLLGARSWREENTAMFALQIAQILSNFPKERPTLSGRYAELYVTEYRRNRERAGVV